MSIVAFVRKWKRLGPSAAACVITILIYWWSAETGFFETNSQQPAESYYNLLVRGFSAGQLNVKRDAPPELAKLANPYDPAANTAYAWDKRYSYEMSYYKGKLYLYFGVTPAVVLFWPYSVLTGHYCTHKNAVLVFDAIGLLAAAWLMYSAWRNYFQETSVWYVVSGVLALGLAPCFMDQLSSCDVHAVPLSCAYAFTMLTLAAIWNALHQPKRQTLWLALASLAYALAVGSRPCLLPGIIILLVPVIPQFWPSAKSALVGQKVRLALAATVPAMLVGIGLAAYNAMRFDNPFEFGWQYQLTDIQNTAAQPFGLHYLWFNLKLYFLEPFYWNSSFPFIQARIPASTPPHYYGVGNPYCGILLNYPLVWFALATTWLWGKQAVAVAGTGMLLRFSWAVLLLFVTGTLTLGCFFCGSSTYLGDFMPALVMLAFLGGCALDCKLKERPHWRRLARAGWCSLVIYSVTVSAFVGFKTHAYANYIVGGSLLNTGRIPEAIEHFKKCSKLDPNPSIYYQALGYAYEQSGELGQEVVELQKAVQHDPKNIVATYDLSVVLFALRRVDEGARTFQKVLELNPDYLNSANAEMENSVAWMLATSPEPDKRNGRIAVWFAEAACKQSDSKVPAMVGTLATAYAEAGQFKDAISTALKACTLAASANDTNSLAGYQAQLSLYQKHEPCHGGPAQAR